MFFVRQCHLPFVHGIWMIRDDPPLPTTSLTRSRSWTRTSPSSTSSECSAVNICFLFVTPAHHDCITLDALQISGSKKSSGGNALLFAARPHSKAEQRSAYIWSLVVSYPLFRYDVDYSMCSESNAMGMDNIFKVRTGLNSD